jgi:hypothetical protein
MKKSVLTAILLSLVCVGVNAQIQVALGLKAGANLSKFDDPDAKNLTGFNGGAFALFKLTKIGIQPEVLFSKQGCTLDLNSLGKFDLKTSYMTIPVMVKLYLVAGLNIQVGPQFGFLTAAEFDKTNIKSDLKSSDLSANFGAGWDLPFGLTVDARYNLGLSDISDSPNLDALKSRVIQISLGYKIIKIGK